MIDGCGSVRWKITSLSPLVATSLMLNHQVLRGFLRSLAVDLAGQHVPGAFDVGAGERLAVVPLHAVAQLKRQRAVVVASSSRMSRGRERSGPAGSAWLSGSNTTRLLNTAMNGMSVEIVASSMDRGAGRVVAMGDAQHAALLLRGRGANRGKQAGDRQPQARAHHSTFPFGHCSYGGQHSRRSECWECGVLRLRRPFGKLGNGTPLIAIMARGSIVSEPTYPRITAVEFVVRTLARPEGK